MLSQKKKKLIIRIIIILIVIAMAGGFIFSAAAGVFAADMVNAVVTVDTFEKGNFQTAFYDAKGEIDQNNVKALYVNGGEFCAEDFAVFQNLSTCKTIDISSATVENGVIPDGFLSGRNVADVKLPSNTTAIGNYAFSGCSSLESVTFSSAITTIGDRAFESCAALKTIYFPATITDIDECAFRGTGLIDVYFSGNAPAVGSEAFPVDATIHITKDATGFDADEWSGYAIMREGADGNPAETTRTENFGASTETVTAEREPVQLTVTEEIKGYTTFGKVAAAVVILGIVAIGIAVAVVRSQKADKAEKTEEKSDE